MGAVIGHFQGGSDACCGSMKRWLQASSAAGGALIAAWIVWTAVQKQINAEQERMTTDRNEAERLPERR